ncbi:MAG: hypothetical protein J5828_05100 [Desulfovibrionaceae bacterium]|nr:hypothetical protein [Desulfovibrionaceae bacterium]
MNLEDVTAGIFEGIQIADQLHRKWTDGYFLNVGPEYFMSCKIAEKIMERANDNERLFFEYSIPAINDNENHRIRGRMPAVFPRYGAIDIAILNEEWHMQYAIEVKDTCEFLGVIDDDVTRLRWLYRQYNKDNGGDLIACIVACYVGVERNTLEGCTEYLTSGINNYREYYGRNNIDIVWDEGHFTEPYTEEDGRVSLSTYFCIVIH